MFNKKSIVGVLLVGIVALGVGVGSMSLADTSDEDTLNNQNDIVIEDQQTDDVFIGGTPGSCGYLWDDERSGWHRPWDADSFIPVADKPEWETFIPETVNIDVSCEDFWVNDSPIVIKKDLSIDIGDSVAVVLCSNPTTGFEWGEAQIKDSSILELVARSYEPGDGAKQNPPIPGSGGTEVLTFQAVDIGKSTVTMEYSQPWEDGQKANWTFVMTVTVK